MLKMKKNKATSSPSTSKKARKDEKCPKDSKNKLKNVQMKKAIFTQTTKLGNQTLSSVIEFESDRIPEQASEEMYDAIFKAAKTCGKLTSLDLKKIDEDVEKFWTKSKCRPSKSLKASSNVSKPEKKSAANKTKTSQKIIDSEDDTEELLRQCDRLLNDEVEFNPSRKKCNKTSSNDVVSGSLRKRRQTKEKVRASSPPVETFVLSSDDEDIANEPSSMGEMIIFTVILKGEKYPMRFYKKQSIRLIRETLANKNCLAAETIEMFLGADVRLEDEKTLADSNITNRCEIDAYHIKKSFQDLYKAGSTSVLRFKCQTNDRTGRQNIFVYVGKSSKMLEVRNQYAEQMGLDPSSLSLRFDGDMISLERNPEECDLEGDECIDIIVAT